MITHVEHITPIVKLNFRTTMLKSSLCDYSDAHTLVKGTITVENTGDLDADENNKNKNVIFRNSRAAKILFEKYLMVCHECPPASV